jgi:hypothetical protein
VEFGGNSDLMTGELNFDSQTGSSLDIKKASGSDFDSPIGETAKK